MTDSINNVLNFLKELNTTSTFTVVIPSTNQELIFKQLNTEQLKQILETIADTTIFNNNFNVTFYKILKANILTQGVNVDDFTIYDAQYIALYMRINSLSEKYTVYFTQDEVQAYELFGNKHEILLKEVVDSKKLTDLQEHVVSENNISITCKVPTLRDENDFIKHFTGKLKTLVNQEIETVVGEIFLYEIVKSIKNITINNTVTEFPALTFNDRVEIVKQLPTLITSKIITYIEKYKQALYDLYLVNIQAQTQNQTIILQKELQYNGTLFNY
jgi:hypothetical protein